MRYLISIILFASCVQTQQQNLDATPSYSSSSLPAKWSSKSVFPLAIKISNDFDADEIQSINNSADNWSDPFSGTNLFNATTSNITEKNSLDAYEDSTLGIYKSFNWPSELPTTALAVTQIKGTQKSNYIRINHADIILNYDYYSFSTGSGWGYDVETVALHELGHLLGLYHTNTSTNDSVMYPSISSSTVNREPKQTDIDNLSDKYNLSTSGSAAPANAIFALKAAPNSELPEESDITIQLEIYPDGSEIIRINGEKHEKVNCHILH